MKVFYRNGNLFKEGFVDENDKLKGQWYYYTLEGKISEMREFNNFSGHVSLNRSVYYKGNLDSMIMEKDPYFNKSKWDCCISREQAFPAAGASKPPLGILPAAGP